MTLRKLQAHAGKMMRRSGTTMLVGIISLVVSGLPHVATLAFADQTPAGTDSKALQTLSKVVRASKNDTVVPMLALQKSLRGLQENNGADRNSIVPAQQTAMAGLRKLHDGLLAVAGDMKDDDDAAELFFSIVISYFSFKGLLQLSYEALEQSGGAAMAGLDLVLPTKVADLVIRFQGQQAAQAGLEVYDISFTSNEAGKGFKKITLNAREASRFRMGAFMAFPSDATAKKQMIFQALKLVFSKQATLNSFLYSDEKVPVVLPAGADPALVAVQTQADAIAHEGAYRNYVTASLLQPLADAVGASRPTFKQSAHAFYQLIAKTMYNRIDVERLNQFISKELAQKIADAEGDEETKEPLIREAVDVIADKFLKLEEQQRTPAIRAALKASPIYLTQMSREDLKATLADAARIAVSNLALVPVDKALMDTDKLSPREQALIFVALTALVDASFKADAIPEKALADFEHSRYDYDVIASFRRYDLAQKVLAGVDWLDGAKEILVKIAKSTTVPASLLPKKPDPGMTLLALHPAEDTPVWALEMLQSVGAKTSGLKQEADFRNLESIARSIPTQLLQVAQDARDRSVNSVLGEIQAVHNSHSSYTAYTWRSLDERLRTLGRRVQSQAARKILLDFLRMGKLADMAGTGVLRDKIRTAFNDLLERKLDGLDELVAEIKRGQSYVASQRDFVQHLFSAPAQRNEFLRGLLSNSATYRNYIQVHIQDMQNTLPLLFSGLKLSSKAQTDTGNPNPVQFSELVSRLKIAINATQADVALGRNVMADLNDDMIRKPDVLNQPAKSPISPHNLLVAACAGTRDDPGIEGKILDWAIDKWTDGKGSPITDDSHWPTQFLVRDVLPAYFDYTTSTYEKVRRIAVSSLLEPYLRSAALAGQSEVNTLTAAKVDHTKALVQSEAYRLVMAEAGDEVGDGMTAIQKKALKWKRRWEAVKRVTMKTQEYSNVLFYETLFLDIPAEGHMIAGLYMALSSFADFTADVGLFVDYWDTYAEMRPFGQSGVLGKGLIAHSELEGIRREMHNMAEVIINRAPMDLWFYTSIGHDVHSAVKQLITQKKYNAATKGMDQQQLSTDIQKLAGSYENIGLDLSVRPEQFKRLYEAKARELAPQLKGNEKVQTEFNRWVEARKQTNEFTRKYAQLFDAIAKMNDGENAPAADGQKAAENAAKAADDPAAANPHVADDAKPDAKPADKK